MIEIKLKEVMEKKRYKNIDLAKESGLTVDTISRIKLNKFKNLSYSSLNAICKVLKCQPGDLLKYKSDK